MKMKWMFIIAAGIGIISLPAIHGIALNSQYNQFIQFINQQSNEFDLEILEYQQGWLSSTVLLQANQNIVQNHEQRGGTIPRLIIQQEVTHGPILWLHTKNGFHLGLGKLITQIKQHQEAPDEWITKLNQVTTLESLVNYNLSSKHYLNIAPNSALMNESTYADWQGMQATISSKRYRNKIYKVFISAKIGEIQIEEINNTKRYLDIQPIHLIANIRSDQNTIETKTLATTPKIELKQTHYPNITLENLNIQTETQKTANRPLEFKTLSNAKQTAISSFALKNLQNIVLFFQGSATPDNQNLEKINANLDVDTAYGKMKITLHSNHFNQEPIETLELHLAKNLGDFIRSNVAQTGSAIDSAGYQAMISELIEKKYIMQNAHEYYFHFRKSGNQQYINNQPIQS